MKPLHLAPLSPARSGAARLALLVLPLFAASGCLGSFAPPPVRPGMIREQTVTILVEGTPGLPFTGSYGTAQTTQSVRGAIPATYTVQSAVGVAATFSKETEQGELVVRLLVDGREVFRRATTLPFGTVTAAYSLVR